MKTFWTIILAIAFAVASISTVAYVMGWFGEAATVAQNEFGATAALQKYEWFIEQATMIHKMDQDVTLFRARIDSINKKYEAYGKPKEWTVDVRMLFNTEMSTAETDLVSIISQRNNIVREYNAASDKFNWSPFKTKLDKPQLRYEELKL